MTGEDEARGRLKFYGLNDYGTYWQVERAAELVERYPSSPTPKDVADVLELYNAQLFAENDLFPNSYTDSQRTASQALVPELRKTVGKYFNALTDANIANILVDVDFEYHSDLMQLLSKYKVYERCASSTLLQVLDEIGIGLGEILAVPDLVRSYDQELRARLLSDPANSELLVRKYLEKDARQEIHLPPSFTDDDARTLLNSYLDSSDARPNFVEIDISRTCDEEWAGRCEDKAQSETMA